MQVIAVNKQDSDELSDRVSTASSNDFETGALLSSQSSRVDADAEAQKANSNSDQEAWYQRPKQECFRYSVFDSGPTVQTTR